MLRPWKISLAERVDRRRSIPVYLQIVHALIHDIQRGRLAPGTFLPSSRELATTLGVNRKTIVIAYDDLIAQGWLASDGTRGTIVSSFLCRSSQPRPAPIPYSPTPGLMWPQRPSSRSVRRPIHFARFCRASLVAQLDVRRRRARCAAVVAGRAVARLPHRVARQAVRGNWLGYGAIRAAQADPARDHRQ